MPFSKGHGEHETEYCRQSYYDANYFIITSNTITALVIDLTLPSNFWQEGLCIKFLKREPVALDRYCLALTRQWATKLTQRAMYAFVYHRIHVAKSLSWKVYKHVSPSRLALHRLLLVKLKLNFLFEDFRLWWWYMELSGCCPVVSL